MDINEEASLEGRALSFTCASVYPTEVSSPIVYTGVYHGELTLLVRGEITECHSERQADPDNLKMACNHYSVVKGCHTAKVELKASNSYKDNNALYAVWKKAQPAIFAKARTSIHMLHAVAMT